MNTKHTPGTWHLGKAGANSAIYGPKGEWIATVPDMLPDSEQMANARLIAAAPGLLEALYQIATYDPTKWDAVTLGNIARAAIVKAGGQ